MSESHDDELRRLVDAMRDEYERSAAPEPPPMATDDATERTVAWLRRAWEVERDEVPVPAIPLALVRAHRRRSRPARRWRAAIAGTALAAAAAAAVVFAIVLDDTTERPDPGATTADADPIGTTVDAHEDVTADATPTSDPFTGNAFRSREDGVELVHGSVRIVLLTSSAVTPTGPESP